MSVLADWEIEYYVKSYDMIEPFTSELVRKIPVADGDQPLNIISYGLSSYGYDLRVGNEFYLHNAGLPDGTVIDPKNFNPGILIKKVVGAECYIDIPPLSPFLCGSIEYFRIPKEIFGLIIIKSTWARCAAITNAAWLEPEWEGHITLELFNTSPIYPLRVYIGEGLVQVAFLRANNQCARSYHDRKGGIGKYQYQKELVVLPKAG